MPWTDVIARALDTTRYEHSTLCCDRISNINHMFIHRSTGSNLFPWSRSCGAKRWRVDLILPFLTVARIK